MGKRGSVWRDAWCIVEATKMMSRIDRFFIALALLYFVGLSVAIYNPSEATTKPPKRREPVLPWYLSGKEYVEPNEDSPRSPKWQTVPDDPVPRKPIAGSNAWTSWRKTAGSDIEQRTEVSKDRALTNYESPDYPLEYDQFEQRENQWFPSGGLKGNNKQGKDKPSSNRSKGKVEDDQDFYEGVPSDSTKPHKEKILQSTKPKSTVARNDPQLGVQCPDSQSTGQFVYPPDCKFFVNCWKGRAFVQPCAPGTLFNPDTLECDFPHKVKCYGGELADFPSSGHLVSSGRHEPLLSGSLVRPEKLQASRCPPHVTGLLPHPTDCTKFLQCANGGTIVMDCGPGTVFNPTLTVCDWPYNVRGCEDAIKSNEDNANPLSPVTVHRQNYDRHKSEYNQQQPAKKIACPADFSGLLPHPETCKKFLQCANGATFIMDCGPGTAFNPAISVCDWPYNVPGCSEDSRINSQTPAPPTTIRPWPPRGSSTSWQNSHPHATTWRPGQNRPPAATNRPPTGWNRWPPTSGQNYPPTTSPKTDWDSLRPTWRPTWSSGQNYPTTTSAPKTDWDSLRPTWRPTWKPNTWTTQRAPYDRGPLGSYDLSSHSTDYNNRYENPHDSTQHKEHGWGSPGSQATDRPDSGGRWHGHRHHESGDRGTPGWHHGHHHDASGDRGTPGWHHSHHVPNRGPWNYPIPDYPDSSDESDQQTLQPPFNAQTGHDGRANPSNRNKTGPRDGNLPANRRTGQETLPNRQEYGRTQPGFSHPGRKPAPDGNIYVDSDYELPENEDSSTSWSPGPKNKTSRRPENRTTWNHPESGGRFIPSTWPGQQGREGQGQGQRPWNQDGSFCESLCGSRDSDCTACKTLHEHAFYFDRPIRTPGCTEGSEKQFKLDANGEVFFSHEQRWTISTCDDGVANGEDKLQGWDSRGNVPAQNGPDRAGDSKLDQWASRTNIFQYAKEQGPGAKDSPKGSTSPPYLSSIYVNINGTQGHLITKEIEVNQGHSKTKTYKPNVSSDSNYGPQSIQDDRLAVPDTRYSLKPSTVLQPPYYSTGNGSIGSLTNINRDANVHGDQQSSKYHSTNLPISDDLVGSHSIDYHRTVLHPATNLQPPRPESPSRSLTVESSTNPASDKKYPPEPATDLQPPPYQPSYSSWTATNSTQWPNINTYPPVPASDVQPPPYQPWSSWGAPNSTQSSNTNRYPPVPATVLQPPPYQPWSSWGAPNSTQWSNINRYPAVPATDLQPPRYQPDTSWDANSTRWPGIEYPATGLQPPRLNSNFTWNDSSPRPPSTFNFSGTSINRSLVRNSTQKLPGEYRPQTSTEKIPSRPAATTDPNVPSVSIEYEDNPSTKKLPDVFESDVDYDVDVMDEKEIWKPVLVFENKTKTTTQPSVIMKVNKKKVDVDLFNAEAAPFQQEEPPFPVYYVPPVEPISHSRKNALLTPISGQVIRLRGGSGPHDGYVEVQGVDPGWGVVCDHSNSWTLKEAHVVCKQLGYSRGAEMAWQGRNNRNGVPSWIAANSVTCTGNETRFQLCKFTHEPQCRLERDAVGVRCTPNRVAHCRKDEVPYEGQCYHLADPDSGLNHAEALEYCGDRQARLIDITNQPENDFVSEWLLQMHPEVGSIMTSGVGFTMLDRTFWLWEDSSKAKFKFTKWWPGWMEDKKHTPVVGARPLCVVMKRKFPCHERPDSICVADYFFWDTEDCATSTKGHSYICKRPYDDIGCIYGKGNQYAGNANVTASGKNCLPWADKAVAHPLRVNVVNRELREKLKMHNYCRNPNPNKESRPWCFTGPSGQREHCDIPSCGNAGNIGPKRALLTEQCKPKHFECLPGECIPSPWVCDGEEDCTNGADERTCTAHLNLFQKHARHKLEGYDVEKWLNTPLKTCALRCKEADFTCRSFAHKAIGNVCLLSDSNVGATGSLKPNKEFDYYEMKERSVNCTGMYVCGNRKCINQTQVCNGKNDCNDRTDENICTVENLDYEIRLAGSNISSEGRVEVKILGVWGQVCDDGFGMIDADVICKELGFDLGALEVRPGGFYGNLEPPTRFMVDQLKCRGNETSLRECDFDGWGVHNCQPEEAVGVACKTAVDNCQEGHWKCDNSPTCIPTAFICDEVVDCPDGSDESSEHCDAPFEIRLVNGSSPLQGRVEVRHHGIWGTVCDDDFSNATAAVICRSLGYGGIAIAKKDGYFGPGEGPIWLDEVYCHGNETQLYRCEHNHWGQHNCDHNEDSGVICTPGDVNDSELHWETGSDLPETSVDDLLPADCGKRPKDFDDDEDLIFAKVVHGSVAPKGTYPWQASIRVRGHSRSSHWCGAVVLSPLHVLTAAHCLEGYNKGTYFVRAGDYNTEIDEGTEAEANIEDYYVHEEFRKGHRMNNDIALVLLKGRGIPLGKDIMPICLPAENTEYPEGLNCTISGFGSIETGKSTHSKDLRYGWIPLLDQSVCRAGHIYGEGAISDGMVCAGYLDEGIDTCDGDSGGPLACYHNGAFTLYGITSWGQHCGRANKPGVYVRISYYRRWIDKKIRESLAGR